MFECIVKQSGARLSIRASLILLALIAISPLIMERMYDVNNERIERIESAYRQALGFARSGANSQDHVIATASTFLTVVARAYPTVAYSTEACGQFLVGVVARAPWIRAVSVADRHGRIVCGSSPNAIGNDVSDRPDFQRVLSNGGFSVSDLTYGRRLSGAAIFAVYAETPTADSVFIAAIDLAWIGRLARTTAEQLSSVVLIVDGNGTVLARHPDSENWVGKQFSDHPLIRTMQARSEGVVREKGIDGVPRVFGFTKLPGSRAHVAVGLDENAVFGRVNRAMQIALMQLGIVTCIVIAGIWFGGERLIAQPIRAFVRTAARVGHGKLGPHGTGKSWAREFIPLAAAIDDMAEKLATRENELQAANTRLHELARVDGLTGVANRRAFDARLQTEWEIAATFQRPIALVMIDLDNFKSFNDHYGHLEGDACLRVVSRILTVACRQDTDLAARYGGEEFVLILSGADYDEALDVAERVRAAVDQLEIPNVEAASGHVTISLGVASMRPVEGTNPQTLIAAADVALYEAKHRGRNRVVAHESVRLLAAG